MELEMTSSSRQIVGKLVDLKQQASQIVGAYLNNYIRN